MPRARPKNSTDLDEIETLPPSSIDKKTVRHIETWTETPPSPQTQLTFEEEVNLEEEALDVFDAVLQDFGGDTSEWSIKVWRLPNYAKDGKTAVAADKIFCLNLPITVDYETIVQQEYGAGVYLLELRQHGRVKKIKRLTIAGTVAAGSLPFIRSTAVNASQNPATMNGTQTAPIPVELPDPAKIFDETIDRMAKMSKLFGVQLNQQAQPVQPAPAAKEDDDQDPILKSFVTVAMADEKMRDRAVNALGGLLKGNNGGPHEVTLLDIGLELVKQFPAMIKSAKDLILEMKGAPNGQPGFSTVSPTQTQSGTGPIGSAPPTAPATTSSSITTTPGLEGIPSHDQVLSFATSEILKALERNEHMVPVVNWLVQKEQEHGKIIGDLIDEFSDASVDNLMAFIQTLPDGQRYTSLPHCRTWIESLQKALKDATDPPEGDQES